MYNLIYLAAKTTAAATTTTTAAGGNDGGFLASILGSGWTMPVIMIGMLVLMYFVTIRPQQKKQKEEQKMRNSLRVGDELTTIGGVKGRVVSIKDETFVLETGADRSKVQFEKWAIQTVHTKHEDPVDDDDDDDDI